MASLEFQYEKRLFRKFYDNNLPQIEEVKHAHILAITQLVGQSDAVEVMKIEGRVKDKEECIGKFRRKYQNKLEAQDQPYEIKDYITDLIGIRIVCLYEDQIPLVADLLKGHYRVIEVTDKIAALENTVDSFGYKCLHMNIAPVDENGDSHAYPIEIQIRTLIQDAWSVLDHKIKYKKSIPTELKRRINVLSALFELADREFKEIRNATQELLALESADMMAEGSEAADGEGRDEGRIDASKTVNAFNFLRIAGHFFKDFDFDDNKVDYFVQDILKLDPSFQRSELHESLIENLKSVKDYRDGFLVQYPESTFSPYTSIRHCLYLYDPDTFGRILSKGPKARFEGWLKEQQGKSDSL